MAEAGLHGDDVVEHGVEGEGPEEEPGSGDAAAEGESEAEEAADREEGEVQLADDFGGDAFFDGVGHAVPEEEDALEDVGSEEAGVGADDRLGAEALLLAVVYFAEAGVALEGGGRWSRWGRWLPRGSPGSRAGRIRRARHRSWRGGGRRRGRRRRCG